MMPTPPKRMEHRALLSTHLHHPQRRTQHLSHLHLRHPRHLQALEAPDAGDRHKSSPLVRKIAKEHNVDIGRIQGSGIGGRVTKQDILGFIDGGGAVTARPASEPRAGAVRSRRGAIRSCRCR